MNHRTRVQAKFRRQLLSLAAVAVVTTSLTAPSLAANLIPGRSWPKGTGQATTVQRRLIEVTADKDNRFHLIGQTDASITVYAGEALRLRITAVKSKNHGSQAHSFTLFRAKDHTAVAGWDITLHTGTHDYDVTAPVEPDEYEVDCTAACSADHDPMTMHFIVVPRE